MTPTSRTARALGSVVFFVAGLAYILLPPLTTISTFDTALPAIAYGCVFAAGGAISLYGVSARYTQIERFGVVLVVIAATCLTLTQGLVMLDGPTWTRLGGTLVYAGYTMWAFERWHSLGADAQAVRALADEDRG